MRLFRNSWTTRRRAQGSQARARTSRDAALKRFGASAAQYPDSEYVRIFEFARAHFGSGQSQILQDLFVLYETKCKRNGFFVEFGAGDGMFLSNSYLLDADFGWRGILAEPARGHHAALRANRTCNIDQRCVWTGSGEFLPFNQTDFAELSTLEQFSGLDMHAQARVTGLRYPVETVSLQDLLMAHQAPREIDYLSIDTEGSELVILGAFDWDAYRIGIITVEHNFTLLREQMFQLLTAKGYIRKFEAVSDFDDWYVKI